MAPPGLFELGRRLLASGLATLLLRVTFVAWGYHGRRRTWLVCGQEGEVGGSVSIKDA